MASRHTELGSVNLGAGDSILGWADTLHQMADPSSTPALLMPRKGARLKEA